MLLQLLLISLLYIECISVGLLSEEPIKFCELNGPGIYGSACSQYFVVCDGSQAAVRRCNGLLYFDEPTLSCVPKIKCKACQETNLHPAASTASVKKPVTPLPVPPSPVIEEALPASGPMPVHRPSHLPPSVPVLQPKVAPESFTCIDKVDGVYKQHCSGLFVVCSKGKATFLMCPSGLLYDGLTAKCQKKVRGCTALNQTKSSTRPVTAFTCKDVKDGYYSHSTVNKIVKCINGGSLLLSCPDGFVLSTPEDLCIKFSIKRAKRYVAYGISPVSNSMLLQSNQYAAVATYPSSLGYYPTCDGLSYGVHAVGCTEKYIVALPDYCSVFTCPVGLMFDIDLEQCAPAVGILACTEQKSTVSTTAAPAIPAKASASIPVTTFDCAKKPDGIYGLGCSKTFAVCVAGTVRLMLCPEGLKFDDISARCLSKAYVAVCGGISTPAPPIPAIVNAPSGREGMRKKAPSAAEHAISIATCSGKTDGVYNLGCLSEFYVCSEAIPVVMECPSDLVFDSFSGSCMSKDAVAVCGGLPSPVSPVKRTSCVDYFGVVSAGCRTYTVCLGEVVQSFLCPVAYVFDLNAHLCVVQTSRNKC